MSVIKLDAKSFDRITNFGKIYVIRPYNPIVKTLKQGSYIYAKHSDDENKGIPTTVKKIKLYQNCKLAIKRNGIDKFNHYKNPLEYYNLLIPEEQQLMNGVVVIKLQYEINS
jgi:ASC-1-like (ASCH) protein